MATEVLPRDLVGPDGAPRALEVADLDLEPLLGEGMALGRGATGDVRRFGPMSMLDALPDGGLVTFLSAPEYAGQLSGRAGHVVVTSERLAGSVPDGNGVVVTDRHPKEAFCAIFEAASARGMFERLASHVSPDASVHRTAFVDDHVYVDADAEIGPGAVIHANSYVGRGVRIAANAVVGEAGFEIVQSGGDRRLVGHAGGVWLADGASVGASACLDRGLYGDFTVVGEQTHMDNLVHVAHATVIGRRCVLTACVCVAGWVTVGDDVWMGPGSLVNQLLTVGDGAYLGTGSVVRRDVPAHALVVGHTARQAGWYCLCRTPLPAGEGEIGCESCGRRYRLEGSTLEVVD